MGTDNMSSAPGGAPSEDASHIDSSHYKALCTLLTKRLRGKYFAKDVLALVLCWDHYLYLFGDCCTQILHKRLSSIGIGEEPIVREAMTHLSEMSQPEVKNAFSLATALYKTIDLGKPPPYSAPETTNEGSIGPPPPYKAPPAYGY